MTEPTPGQEPDITPVVSGTATSEGQVNQGPGFWNIPPSLCGTGWDNLPVATQDYALAMASYIIWSATGRQFSLVEVTIRPYGRWHESGWQWGWQWWSSGMWTPWLWAEAIYGPYYPCFTSMNPKNQIPLPGPVASVTQVVVDGETVDPATYRVDNNQWLVRQGKDSDGNFNTWPVRQDFNMPSGSDNTMTVTYNRGWPPPSAVLYAAGILAAEFGKSCSGQDCRLPGRLSQLTRAGVTMTNVDLDELLDKGLVGIPEVDFIIRAANPYQMTSRNRVLSPDSPSLLNRFTTQVGG